MCEQDQEQKVEITILRETASSSTARPCVAAAAATLAAAASSLDDSDTVESLHHFLLGHSAESVGEGEEDAGGREGGEEAVSLETLETCAVSTSAEDKAGGRRKRDGDKLSRVLDLDFRHSMLEETKEGRGEEISGKEGSGEGVGSGEYGASSEEVGFREDVTQDASAAVTMGAPSVKDGKNVWEERIARDKKAREET